jgi:hypothetical protein
VLQASGPSAANFRQGVVLNEARQISLAKGDSLRLLVSGQTLMLQRPYNGTARHSPATGNGGPAWDGVLLAKPGSRSAAVRGFLSASPPQERTTTIEH